MAHIIIEAVADGDARELLGADVGGAYERELAGVDARVVEEDEIREG